MLLKKSLLWRIGVSAALLIACFFVPMADGPLSFLLYLLPYLIIGYDVLLDAGRNALRGQVFDEQLLMELGRNPTLEEIAQAMHLTPEQAAVVENMVKNCGKERLKAEDYLHIHVVPSDNKALLERRYRVSDRGMERVPLTKEEMA